MPSDKIIAIRAARCTWIVTAGIVPGQIESSFTSTFQITADEWGSLSPADQILLFHQRKADATHYAAEIMNPGFVNWVRVEWIWF